MKVAEKYSHLNGEEFLLVHHKSLYDELLAVVAAVDASELRTKKSEEKRTLDRMFYDPVALNKAFHSELKACGWQSVTYRYYVATDFATVQVIQALPLSEQRDELLARGIANPIQSYKQTDFVKSNVAIEVQFGKYAFVAYDLFVKHLLFYAGGVINVGIEVLPMKAMQTEMSSGVAYYEGEVYNVLRHGRNNPAVPLLVLGVIP